jgi:hypothetical protein
MLTVLQLVSVELCAYGAWKGTLVIGLVYTFV